MIKVALFVALTLLFSTSAQSEESEKKDAIIAMVVGAYGGEKFAQMRAYKVMDKYKSFRYGQSYRPDSVDMISNHAATTVDFEGNRKDFRWIRGFKDDFFTHHQMFDGALGYRIEHAESSWRISESISFNRADRFHSLFLDTHLAKMISQPNADISVKKPTHRHGKTFEVLEINSANAPKLTVYVNAENGFIVKMVRPSWRPDMGFEYHYENHVKQNGITYATDFYVTRSGDPYYVSTQREVQFDLDVASMEFRKYFRVPKEYVQDKRSVDYSSMTVTALSTNLYLVGKEWGFSVFYEAEDYFIATGGYEGLTDRLQAVNEFVGKNKPLKYQIVTHHHIDHLGGAEEAVALGAKFITVKSNIPSIQLMLDEPVAESRFITFEDETSMLNGKVKILDFPNEHANHSLISYFTDEKVIFSADLFISRQEAGAPQGYPGLIDFKQAIESAGFEPQLFAASHSGRVLTLDDLNESISNIKPPVCPQYWAICL